MVCHVAAVGATLLKRHASRRVLAAHAICPPPMSLALPVVRQLSDRPLATATARRVRCILNILSDATWLLISVFFRRCFSLATATAVAAETASLSAWTTLNDLRSGEQPLLLLVFSGFIKWTASAELLRALHIRTIFFTIHFPIVNIISQANC